VPVTVHIKAAMARSMARALVVAIVRWACVLRSYLDGVATISKVYVFCGRLKSVLLYVEWSDSVTIQKRHIYGDILDSRASPCPDVEYIGS
jgi:hypothetical protein